MDALLLVGRGSDRDTMNTISLGPVCLSNRQFAGIGNLTTAIFDAFPKLRTKKWLVTGVLCAILYVAGFSMCTKVSVGNRVYCTILRHP